jgi:WD40 repeat protein
MNLVRDARRFILYHKSAIENGPLQVYALALVFSSASSTTRELFNQEDRKWITTKSAMEDDWGSCLQTLEGHSSWVGSVAFSHNSILVASASNDRTVKIWEIATGQCLQTLEGHLD